MKIKDNNAKASINFQKANMKVAAFHNAREAFTPKSSHAELAEKNECSCSALAAIKKIQKWDEKADQNYAKNHGGRRSPVKETSKVWEAVVNLRENHTMADVKKLTKKLEEKTGYKAAQIAIHRDEGHTNDDGDFIQNIHAHILFYARDPKTGLSLSTQYYGKTEFFEEIQDLVADELGMERGQSAKITGAKHENMHSFKARKQAEREERAQNKEWQAKLEANNKAWQEKKAEWEAKQAEREARREEWELKLPEIMAARRRNEQFLNGRVDWETLKTANKAFLLWHDISTDLLGYPNPNGNLLVEQSKGALASIFRLFGSVSQLAIFLLTRTEARELKLKNALDVYKVSENLQRAVNLVANDTTNDHRKIAEKIQSVFTNLPVDKRQELIELAILHAPNDEIRNDIRALIEGRFSHIARTEQAQKRIENRDLRAELREYAEEARKIRDELKAMDEENRILNLAERALLREKGANRSEYAEQEADNKARLEELKTLRQQVKDLNNDILNAKKQSELDKEKIAEQAAQIKELNEKIAEITEANVKKQKQLEAEKEEARQTAPQMPPKGAFDIIDELEAEKQPEPVKTEPKSEPAKIEQKPEDAFDIFDIIDEQKPEKIEPEPEPEPIAKKADDNLNIYGYARPQVEPRRHRFDDYEPRKREIDDRPRYTEPEPEKIEQREEQKDEWQEIEDAIEKWRKTEDVGSKTLLTVDILGKLNAYEKSGWDISLEKQIRMNNFRRVANYDPVADELEAQKNAETIRKVAAIHRELEQKRQAEIQIETAIKYEDVKAKNVRKEDETRQRTLKKRKDELEMGMS